MKKPNWSAVLRKAGKAGRKAILQNYTESSRHKVLRKGMGGDMTLRIDEVSERAIFRSLKSDLGKSFVFLSEEVGEVPNIARADEETPIVVCDPLDGSHNAEAGIPLFSLALSVIGPTSQNQKRSFGNVTNALITSIKTEDEFFAENGKGSFHNGRRMKPSERATSLEIQTLLVETSDVDYLRDNILSKLSKADINKTRLLGTAAITYCMLASGSAQGMIFAQPGGARTIDSPAGFLIAREAGCVFSNITAGAQDSDR